MAKHVVRDARVFSDARVEEISALLPEAPQGVGRPIMDRGYWERPIARAALAETVAAAENVGPLPETTDELYLEFSRTGSRTAWQEVAWSRRRRLPKLVIAECAENRGRFVPAICEVIASVCAERTWVMPAHDRLLKNFRGGFIDIDLMSSALAWQFATAAWLLGDSLPAASRELIREKVEERALQPYHDMIAGRRERDWWLDTTNNWNAVCLAGVTGAALALVLSRRERGWFVAAAEAYQQNFLEGFTPDGYCSEGMGYWGYGFGTYLELCEILRQATGGGVDLLLQPAARNPALYSSRIGLTRESFPSFADCQVGSRPAAWMLNHIHRRLGEGMRKADRPQIADFADLLMDRVASAQQCENDAAALPLRNWFADAGVLVSRPGEQSACRMSVALKGGHNAEHHNHNDVGTYVVALGDRQVLLDAGGEIYTARTFSKDRYEGKLLNSYGHAVPVVAGQLQRTGREAAARVLRTEFTEVADTLELELTSCYEAPDLVSLTRTFVYSRSGKGSLTVIDRVRFRRPQTFETALITRGEFEGSGELLIRDEGETLRVGVEGSAEFTVSGERFAENALVNPTRIAIRLREPVLEAEVRLQIRS